MTHPISRRRFCATAAAASAAAVTGCSLGPTTTFITYDGRVTARPGEPPTTTIAPGIHDILVGNSDRFCWLIVPEGYDPTRPWPLALFFRGAITPARAYMDIFKPLADELGLIILAPEAGSRTWDLILGGGFGSDVIFINAALQTAYRTVNVDPARISTSGFSDGASYSLSLGLTNGDFCTKIAAYSPGFMQVTEERGKPEFFISHGNMDQVLPVYSSQYIVEQLQGAGYTVDYREWDGPHAIKLSLARESFAWMVGDAGSPLSRG